MRTFRVVSRPRDTKRNLVIKFGGGYRVAKVVYDSRGDGPAKGLFQSSFKLALGYGGWDDQKLWFASSREKARKLEYSGQI